jgi:murein DD-endopeptidase MepM/ murein hydrolase activator NlpD
MAAKVEKKKFIHKLKDKYRLIIVSDNTFEERISLKLSRLNVIAVIATAVLLLSVIIVSLIVYTPVKEMIPGYSDANAKRQARQAFQTAEKMEADLSIRENYLNDVIKVLKGEMEPTEFQVDTSSSSTEAAANVDFSISERDSALRAEVAAEEQYNLKFENVVSRTAVTALSNTVFFSPLRGTISSGYDIGTEHLGVDIVAPDNETIKSTLDGTVILATWTSSEGYVIAIQHPDDLVSFYKHNSVLLKKVGERVEVGESIAIIGNSGELTDGPHLHFELWYKGDPLDPQEFILFN